MEKPSLNFQPSDQPTGTVCAHLLAFAYHNVFFFLSHLVPAPGPLQGSHRGWIPSLGFVLESIGWRSCEKASRVLGRIAMREQIRRLWCLKTVELVALWVLVRFFLNNLVWFHRRDWKNWKTSELNLTIPCGSDKPRVSMPMHFSRLLVRSVSVNLYYAGWYCIALSRTSLSRETLHVLGFVCSVFFVSPKRSYYIAVPYVVMRCVFEFSELDSTAGWCFVCCMGIQHSGCHYCRTQLKPESDWS